MWAIWFELPSNKSTLIEWDFECIRIRFENVCVQIAYYIMVLIADSGLGHVAHVLRKAGLFENKFIFATYVDLDKCLHRFHSACEYLLPELTYDAMTILIY